MDFDWTSIDISMDATIKLNGISFVLQIQSFQASIFLLLKM